MKPPQQLAGSTYIYSFRCSGWYDDINECEVKYNVVIDVEATDHSQAVEKALKTIPKQADGYGQPSIGLISIVEKGIKKEEST